MTTPEPAAPGHPALASATWPEVPPTALLVVPVGSLEQHGPHLPLDTDTQIADAVTRAVVAAVPGALVAPAVSYGASGEHEGFSGTVSCGAQALELALLELGRSAFRWADRVLFINGHGGNASPLARAVRLLRYEGRNAAWWPCAVTRTAGHAPDAHAGRTETSLMLHLDPVVVRWDRAEAGERRSIAELMPLLRQAGVRAVSPNGVLGDPAGSTAEEGRQLMSHLVAGATTAVGQWVPDVDGRLG